MIGKEKWDALNERLAKLGVHSSDLITKAVLGSGPGGQKVNKCATTIYIKHLPTGIEIKCGKERSQTLNHYRALSLLCEKLEEQIEGEKSQKAQELAKLRKQKQRRSRRTQQKLAIDKKQLSQKKDLRKSPEWNDS